MVPIVKDWMFQYVDNPQTIETFLKKSDVAREIGRSVYQYFVNTNQLKRIEDYEEKQRIWDIAKKWNGESREQTIKLAKTIYLFETLLGKQIY